MRIAAVLVPLLLAPAAARAQDLAGRIAGAPADALVRFTYDAKPGLCGDGENIRFRRDRDLREQCDEGPVRVTLERSGTRITDVDVEVGGLPEVREGVVDLGHVPAASAAAYFLETLVPA
ncbi:MAG: hypothetical protein ACRELX_03455, partial [Longimicrobiales bacterium]